MKKLFTSIGLGIALGITPTLQAANFVVSSFLNPSVSSIVISNKVGITNLNWIAQNAQQGQYQLGTNTAGTGINSPIATNTLTMNWLIYTNSTPVSWFGQLYPGSQVVVTNQAVAAASSTNDLLYVTQNTNNAINFFQDVVLPQDFYNALVTDAGTPGAAGSTNSVGILQVVTEQFTQTGYAVGAGSNIVNLTFTPIAVPPPANGSTYGIPGLQVGMDQTFGDMVWTVTFTNAISTVGAPTVYNTPIPRWVLYTRGMRLRNAYTGTSTNAINLMSVTASVYVP